MGERLWDRWATATAVFLAAATAFLASPVLDGMVPDGILTNLRRNNEALVFAALVVLLVPVTSLMPKRPPVAWWVALATGFALTEIWGADIGFPPWVITLNEAILGATVVAIYLYLTTRGERRRPWIYAVLLAVILLGEVPVPGLFASDPALWIVNHAEAWGFALLAALYLDFIRPWPFARRVAPVWARTAWYAGLAIVPLVLSLLNENGVDSAAAVGPLESTLVWVQRITEAFIAALIISVYYDLRVTLAARARRA